MQNKKYSIAAFIIAMSLWFTDSAIHYFAYGEDQFEIIPDDFNELWIRSVIVILIILFGIYADYSTSRLLNKEKQLEAARIYNSMIVASQHILNNLLNQMQLIKLEAMKSNDFDKEIIEVYDNIISEAQDLIQRLSAVEDITDENIWASVDPGKIFKSCNKPDSIDEKDSMTG